jgi:hypothetical protein
MKKQFHHAANAAAGAWDAFADIPIVGPELGAAAAAATFTGVMALAAFEQGGVAGGNFRYGTPVPILAHAGERILTTAQSQNFERMVNNNNSGGNLTVQMPISHSSSNNDRQFRAMLQRHQDVVYSAGRQHLRKMGVRGA